MDRKKKNLPTVKQATQVPNTTNSDELIVTGQPLVVVPDNKALALKGLAAKIRKEKGPKALFTGEELDAIELRSTTIEAFDDILGGGLPVGGLIELWGEDDNGKLSFLYSLMKPYGDYCLYIDAEYSADKKLMQLLGVSPNIIISHPETLEDAFELVFKFVEQGMPLVVIDSVPALTPSQVLKQETKSFEKNPGVALRAGFITTHIYPLKRAAYRSGSTIIFTNQLRDKMNAVAFGEQFNSPGGHALKSAFNVRIKVGRSKYHKLDKTHGSVTFGQAIALQVYQSKVGRPMQDTTVHLIYGHGIVDMLEVRDFEKALEKDAKILEGVVVTEEENDDKTE